MSEASDIRAQAERAIAERLSRGEAGWDELRANDFPTVPRSTWFRWINDVRVASAVDLARQEAVREVQTQLEAARADGDAASAIVVAADYVPPSEEMGIRGFDLPRRIREAFADIDLLAAHAKAKDGGVRVPLYLTQALALKQRYIETALKVATAAIDLEFQAAFYDKIVSVIVEEMAEVPEVQARVIRRMHGLIGERDRTRPPR